jgi:hypothetical protein
MGEMSRTRTSLATHLAGCLVVAAGLFQLGALALRDPRLIAAGTAYAVSPYPLLFGQWEGLEAFATDVELSGSDREGRLERIRLQPHTLSGLSGPWARRHAYVGALLLAPRLPERLVQSVARYGMCDGGPLARALGFGPALASVSWKIETRTQGWLGLWNFETDCERKEER